MARHVSISTYQAWKNTPRHIPEDINNMRRVASALTDGAKPLRETSTEVWGGGGPVGPCDQPGMRVEVEGDNQCQGKRVCVFV